MSWSGTSTINKDGADLVESVQAILVTGNDQAPRERDEQIEAAKRAAISLLTSDAFASISGAVRVSLSGHANPGHQPVEGMSNDYIDVQVAQASR